MKFVKKIPLPHTQLDHLNYMLKAGNANWVESFTMAFNGGLFSPWFVSPDRQMIVFAQRVSGAIRKIVVCVIAVGNELMSDSPGYLFELVAGEGWMCIPERRHARLEHIRKAVNEARDARQ